MTAAQRREAVRRVRCARRLFDRAREYRELAESLEDEACRLAEELRELMAGREPNQRFAGAVLPDLRH